VIIRVVETDLTTGEVVAEETGSIEAVEAVEAVETGLIGAVVTMPDLALTEEEEAVAAVAAVVVVVVVVLKTEDPCNAQALVKILVLKEDRTIGAMLAATVGAIVTTEPKATDALLVIRMPAFVLTCESQPEPHLHLHLLLLLPPKIFVTAVECKHQARMKCRATAPPPRATIFGRISRPASLKSLLLIELARRPLSRSCWTRRSLWKRGRHCSWRHRSWPSSANGSCKRLTFARRKRWSGD
jgi:hypothetical protein